MAEKYTKTMDARRTPRMFGLLLQHSQVKSYEHLRALCVGCIGHVAPALQNNLPISWHGNGAGKARIGVGNNGESDPVAETTCGSLGSLHI